jgi:hypothetical protein
MNILVTLVANRYLLAVYSRQVQLEASNMLPSFADMANMVHLNSFRSTTDCTVI